MGLYLGGLIIGRIFASEIWGFIFGRGSIFYFFWGVGGGGAYYNKYNMNIPRYFKVLPEMTRAQQELRIL